MSGICILFTGYSASGKTTLSQGIANYFTAHNRQVTVLDGDVVRKIISSGLGFSREDRVLNLQRMGFIAGEIVKHGGICIIAAIAPYEACRQAVRSQINGKYIEIHVCTPLEVCIKRDPKKLYELAIKGEVNNFTGISDTYETPVKPDLRIDTTGRSVENCIEEIIDLVKISIN